MRAFAASLIFVSTAALPQTHANRLRPVSIISLIATPDAFDGKRVYVTGYLDCSYEAEALYLDEVDAREGLTKNAVKLVLDHHINSEQEQHCKALSGKYVLVESTFEKAGIYESQFSGYLLRITRLQGVTRNP